MSLSMRKIVVSQIQAYGNTYYVCNYRPDGVTLDGQLYSPLLVSIGDASRFGNFGEGFQSGSCSVELLNGTQHDQGQYVFNIATNWNNQLCEIRLCDLVTDTTWAGCDLYYKGIIKDFSFSDGGISFSIDDHNQKDDITLPRYTVEKFIDDERPLLSSSTDVPSASKGKRIPIQIGDLSAEPSNGRFAKGIALTNKIGFQEIMFDTTTLAALSNIGIWDNDLKRYFTALQRTIVDGDVRGEYEISTTYNSISFKVDSATTLTVDCTDAETTLTVNDYTRLQWLDEDTVDDWQKAPELLSTNIIRIEDELILIAEKPSTYTIYVERGYCGSSAAAHSAGAAIYQSAKFASKNLLTFTERFRPTGIGNIHHNPALATYNPITSGKWSNIVDNDAGDVNYLELTSKASGSIQLNFDIKFPTVGLTESAYNTYFGIKFYTNILVANPAGNFRMYLLRGDNTNYDSFAPSSTGSEEYNRVLTISKVATGDVTYDGATAIVREQYTDPSGLFVYFPELSAWAVGETDIRVRVLTDFNDKWKVHIQLTQGENILRIYAVCFYVDFFTDYTKQNILAAVNGRCASSTIAAITGCVAGSTLDNPVEVLAHILHDEMDYSSAQFDTASWQTAYTYYNTAAAIGTVPGVAFSFGISESAKGWELVEKIAQQYLLSVIKTDDGKLKIINLHKLQNTDGTYGYPSATAYKISIDDFLMVGNNRNLSIQQTGTDRLRNAVKVNYFRNNSTDEYQKNYEVTDAYTLPESSITLLQARARYYNGSKTETLEIDAFAIYQDIDAQRLAKWHANDKAEVHFWLQGTIDHEHYNLVQSPAKSAQYDVGDLIYLDGTYCGITFSSSLPWVIMEVVKKDQGRELEIHAKSIDPISSFTCNADIDPYHSSTSSASSISSSSKSSVSSSSSSKSSTSSPSSTSSISSSSSSSTSSQSSSSKSSISSSESSTSSASSISSSESSTSSASSISSSDSSTSSISSSGSSTSSPSSEGV